MADCAEIRDRFYSYATGECEAESAGVVEAHLKECGACRNELSRMREVARLTELLGKIKPSHDLYPGVAARLRPHIFYLQIAAAAAAAAVLVIALLYALVGPVEPVERTVPDSQATRREEPKKVRVVENEPASAPEEQPELANVPEQKPEEKAIVADRPRNEIPEEPKQPADTQERVVKIPEPEDKEEKKPVQEPDGPELLAEVGKLTGEVTVRRAGNEEQLEEGVLFSILPGDRLSTNSLGRVRIDLRGGDFLYINNNANVTISKEKDEVTVKVEKGEVFLEKDSAEGSVAVDTGFGRVKTCKGRFSLKMSGVHKCLVHVLSGEVECRESGKGFCGKYGELTRAWFQRGRRCQKGTKLRSNEAIKWMMKMRPERQEKQAEACEPGKKDKPDDSGIPPGGIPPKPHDKDGEKGKVGPGPSPMPPKPGGGGKQPGGKQGGQNGSPGGKK